MSPRVQTCPGPSFGSDGCWHHCVQPHCAQGLTGRWAQGTRAGGPVSRSRARFYFVLLSPCDQKRVQEPGLVQLLCRSLGRGGRGAAGSLPSGWPRGAALCSGVCPSTASHVAGLSPMAGAGPSQPSCFAGAQAGCPTWQREAEPEAPRISSPGARQARDCLARPRGLQTFSRWGCGSRRQLHAALSAEVPSPAPDAGTHRPAPGRVRMGTRRAAGRAVGQCWGCCPSGPRKWA